MGILIETCGLYRSLNESTMVTHSNLTINVYTFPVNVMNIQEPCNALGVLGDPNKYILNHKQM